MSSTDVDTWMPFYVADYLRDTRHLSATEHGAYMLLIMQAWTQGGLLPLDPVRLARIAGLSRDEWAEKGDIRIHFCFIPANRRGDRTNFPNRLKPYIDGIADALRINDSRFLPSYEFRAPEAPGKLIVEVAA